MKTYDDAIRELSQKQPNVQYVDMPEVSEQQVIDRATAHRNHDLYTQDQLDYIVENAQFIADDVNNVAECCTEKVPVTKVIDKVMGLFNEYHVSQEFEVTITETLSRTVKVSAKSAENAQAIAEDKWNAGEIALDCENFKNVDYAVAPLKPQEIAQEQAQRPSIRERMQEIARKNAIATPQQKEHEVHHER